MAKPHAMPPPASKLPVAENDPTIGELLFMAVPRALFVHLAQVARRRGQTVAQLLADAVSLVLRHDLTLAMLDDVAAKATSEGMTVAEWLKKAVISRNHGTPR